MTGAQASSLAITRGRDNAATETVALQSYPVATAPGTDVMNVTSNSKSSPHPSAINYQHVSVYIIAGG